MGSPVVHFEIGVKNIDKAVSFYSGLFDWQVAKFEPMEYWGVATQNDFGIGGGIFPAPEGVPTFVSVYAQVDDIQSYLDKSVELGGQVIMPRTPIEMVGEVGMFTDPEGNAFGLYKPLPQS
jgi:hypothetical protein